MESKKHVMNFYVFIGRKAVNLKDLRANRYEWMEMYLFVHKDLIGCKFWQRPCNTILCTGDSLTDRMLASIAYTTLYFGGLGFLTNDDQFHRLETFSVLSLVRVTWRTQAEVIQNLEA